jgi:hypothetical protein
MDVLETVELRLSAIAASEERTRDALIAVAERVRPASAQVADSFLSVADLCAINARELRDLGELVAAYRALE